MKYILIALGALVIILGWIAFFGGGLLGGEIGYGDESNHASVAASASTSTLLLAARSQVNYRAVYNDGNTGEHVLIGCLDTVKGGYAIASSGYILAPGSTWEMSEEKGNLCRNNLVMVASSGTPTVKAYQLP